MLIVVTCLGVTGCVSGPPLREPPVYDGPNDLHARWQAYADFVNQAALQDDCRPRLIEPDAEVQYRGTAVLFHGFSACPQQYFEMAGKLTARGIRVLLPLLPGNGRLPPAPGKDDYSELPTARTWEESYGRLATEMNAIMALADGDRIIGGLSVGAAASVYANIQAPELYDRHLLFSPYFAAATGGFGGGLIRFASRTPGLRALSVKPFGAKKPCLAKREQGRAGMCNYKLAHVGAFNELARDNVQELTVGGPDGALRIQVVGVENDPTVSNDVIRELLDLTEGDLHEGVCFYPHGSPHSLFSRHDNPGVDMYWLESLLAHTVEFIVGGTYFPVGDVSEPEQPWPLCRI